MKDLVFFETVEEYRGDIRARFDEYFMCELDEWNLPKLRTQSFYSHLVDWVIDHRAPIFYRISHPSEHFAFSGAYSFETERERYTNRFRLNLFWLHDFTHMLFEYPLDVYETSEKEFLDAFVYQERLASTETEVFAYYRIPPLRKHVFDDEVLYYDVMRARGYYGQRSHATDWPTTNKPDAMRFLNHRNLLVMDDEYGQAELGEYPDILKFFQQWRRLTPQWCGERYKSMVGVRLPELERPWPILTGENYEQVISEYEWSGTQEGYEATTMDNIRRAYAMLGWDNPPTRWRHVPEAFDSLEGAVFFQ